MTRGIHHGRFVLAVLLSDVRFGVVVIVHDSNGRRAIHVVAAPCRLRPAVYQIGKDGIRIYRGKEDIQKLIHRLAALPFRLPWDVRLRLDGRISDGLRVATDESRCVIPLLQIRDRRRDRIVLLRGFILGHRCFILVRTDNGMAAGERQRIDGERFRADRFIRTAARIDSAHLPCHRRCRIIFTEKKRRRCICPQLVPRLLRISRFLWFIKVKILRHLTRRVFLGKEFFQLREECLNASLDRIRRRLQSRVAADAGRRHRICRIDAAAFSERILRLDRHVSLCVDRASHISTRFRVSDPKPYRESQRLPGVRRTRAQRADGFRTDIHVPLAHDRRLFSHLSRDIAMDLRPREIQRQPACRHDIEILQAHLDGIRAFRLHRRILRCGDRAVVHIDIRLHVADAHVKAEAYKVYIERRDIRLRVRRDLHIAMLLGARAIS